MIRKHSLILLCVSVLSGSGFVLADSGDASSGESFATVYAAATAALAEAEAIRNVWSNTERLLRQAQTANDEGRTDEAVRLATEAKLQAELALIQAISEKELWRTRVLTE